MPLRPLAGFGDGAVGSVLVAGITGALYNRTKTNKGDLVKTSLYGCSLWYNSSGLIMGQP